MLGHWGIFLNRTKDFTGWTLPCSVLFVMRFSTQRKDGKTILYAGVQQQEKLSL